MKSRHYFDPRKDEPPYWFRESRADLEEHRRMIADHERLHRPDAPKQARRRK